jgi:hypothetical protein
MPLRLALFTNVSARKAPERSKLVKDLVLEVPRFPLTRRETLFPTSSLVAEAAYLKRYWLDVNLCRGTQYMNPRRSTTFTLRC